MYKVLMGRLAYVYWLTRRLSRKLVAAAEERKALAAAVTAADRAEEAAAILNHLEIC